MIDGTKGGMVDDTKEDEEKKKKRNDYSSQVEDRIAFMSSHSCKWLIKCLYVICIKSKKINK